MDYIPLNIHMHVKNHMAMWFLWFLWFLRVEYSANPLYKPLCAFLVFVDLLWFLCGSFCGFWSRVFFGSGLRVRSTSCGFCGSVVLPSMLDADDCASTWRRYLWICGLVSMLMIARPLALCGLLKRFAHLPASCYVPFRRHWGRPLQMEKTIMARTSVKVRLRNVRIAYPRLFTPDEKTGKRSCLIMIPNDSEAAQAWRRGVAEAWRVAQDELSKASFPDNPSPALTRAMLGIKVAGEISPSGSVYPEEYAGHIVFTASSKRDISVCNNRGNAINATDEDSIYSGQIAHVAIELFPFKIPEKTGISRILQNVFIVGGGERIALGSGSHNLSAAEEWADEISESSSSSFDDDAASFPF